jgi:hypothetical protein
MKTWAWQGFVKIYLISRCLPWTVFGTKSLSTILVIVHKVGTVNAFYKLACKTSTKSFKEPHVVDSQFWRLEGTQVEILLVCTTSLCVAWQSGLLGLWEMTTICVKFNNSASLKTIWANQPIYPFLVGCLNPCLQGRSVWVGLPQPLKTLIPGNFFLS